MLTVAVAAGIISQFSTPESRAEIGKIVDAVPPILRGLAGKPVNVGTLGGYLQYKYGGFFPLVIGLWSILALSGTLAAESVRGSLDIVAAAPISRRRIALEKIAGHVLMLTIAMLVVGGATALAGSAFATLPGDDISAAAAFSYALWLGLMALIAGAVAFALAPFVGRGGGGWHRRRAHARRLPAQRLSGSDPAARARRRGSAGSRGPANHIPLAGRYDWPSIVLVAVVAAVLLLVGIEAFARRDLGVTSAIPGPRLPRALLGLRGPVRRASSERLPTALGWGLGLGLFGLVIASSGSAFVDTLAKSPDFLQAMQRLFPGTDVASVGGFLELVFIEFGLVLAGLAAAGLVGGWASDERTGRDEMLLAAPLQRSRWPLSGAVAVLVAIGVIVVLTAIGIAIGTLSAGGEVATPVAGTLAIGLYAAAMAGIGIAVGGLVGPAFAAPTVAGVTIVTWLIDLVGGDLGLPDAIHQLALSSHMGQPMVGAWDPVGVVACLLLAAGGTALGTWGFARRDLRS